MRFLLSAVLFFFSQVISLQYVQGKGVDAAKADASIPVFNSKKFYINPPSKKRSSFKKAFFEDVTVVNLLSKKPGLTPFLILKRFEKQYYIQPVLIKVCYTIRHFSYTYIFGFLYPKHVFW